jgi:exopolyphosphatase/pppGpp-phosphohydrolase
MVWLGRGFDQWKLGSTDQAERSLREGLRIAMALKDEAPSLITELRLNALQQYDNYLKATHRKPEAREVEDQIAQLRSVRPSGCRECTVHVSALLPATSPR